MSDPFQACDLHGHLSCGDALCVAYGPYAGAFAKWKTSTPAASRALHVPIPPVVRATGDRGEDEHLLSVELQRRRVRELADQRERGPTPPMVGMTTDELRARPRSEWLIRGWLDKGKLARLNGPPGHYKSFMALDWAACVATGLPWNGFEVTRAVVVYVAAEGAEDMPERVDAWREHRGAPDPPIIWYDWPPQLLGSEWPRFVEYCLNVKAGFVLLDTQSRHTEGVLENDAGAASKVVAAVDRLRVGTGAGVLTLHHMGTSGERGRGSTVWDGALDMEMSMVRSADKASVVLKNPKRRRSAEHDDALFRVQAVGESMVLVADDGSYPSGGPTKEAITRMAARIEAEYMVETYAGGSGGSESDIRSAAVDLMMLGDPKLHHGTAKSRARRGWTELEKTGRLTRPDTRLRKYLYEVVEGLDLLDPRPSPRTGSDEE